jgi:acetylornithine/succinyldiaminopimelate/putrescine aminotransferase
MTCQELAAYARLSLDVRGAAGDELLLADGRRVLDLYGGHCVNTLGAGDRGLAAVLARQWERLSFATNLLALEERERFLAAFGATLPSGDWRVFASNSGAEANENALKAALAATQRGALVAFEGAFHGRTAGATAVTDTETGGFPRAPFDVRRVPFGDGEAARTAIDDDVAAVLLEPIQSLAGVVTATTPFLRLLRERCDAAGALLVFDEVQTGNGRLGTPWAAQSFDVLPDALTTAKGAASGLPIGLTVLTEALAARVDGKLFGSTFGGGPLVLAAATEVSRRIADGPLLANVARASAAFRAAAEGTLVRRVRGRGLLLGLELEPGLSAAEAQRALLDAGVLVGTSNDPRVLRLTPALTVDPQSAERLRAALQTLEVSA